MQDRQPGAPGQYKAILTAAEFQKMQAGEQFTITMTRDDQPIVEGTPYSKAAVLPDELAAIICPDVLNPTPADALAALLPRNGTVPMVGDLDMGGHQVKDIAAPTEDGDAVTLKYVNEKFAPAVESVSYPGCYYRMVDGVQEWLNPPMVPGVEYRTTERHNGKVAYTKLLTPGYIGLGATTVPMGVNYYQVYRYTGIATNTGAGATVALPFADETGAIIRCTLVAGNFIITANSSAFSGYNSEATIWYTKD